MKIYYLPNIAYFQELVSLNTVVFELNETYFRQTYRNRTELVGPNGKMVLSIPTYKLEKGERFYSNIKISYAEPWLKQHWKSFESAYRRSAYFEYYEDKFKSFYDKPKFEYLWEFNLELTKVLLSTLKIEKKIELNSVNAEEDSYSNHLRINTKYFQVFSNKLPFIENLSIIDLLFNMGPSSSKFLY